MTLQNSRQNSHCLRSQTYHHQKHCLNRLQEASSTFKPLFFEWVTMKGQWKDWINTLRLFFMKENDSYRQDSFLFGFFSTPTALFLILSQGQMMLSVSSANFFQFIPLQNSVKCKEYHLELTFQIYQQTTCRLTCWGFLCKQCLNVYYAKSLLFVHLKFLLDFIVIFWAICFDKFWRFWREVTLDEEVDE